MCGMDKSCRERGQRAHRWGVYGCVCWMKEQTREAGSPAHLLSSSVLSSTRVFWPSHPILYGVIVAITYLTFTLPIMALSDV